MHILDILNSIFATIVKFMEQILFVSVAGIPLIILWLIVGGVFFTCRFQFINIWGLAPALKLIWQDLGSSSQKIGISPFQALTTALSGTIGLGNIAGVAIAIQTGGIGTVFWMSLAAWLGMASKFIECTLGQKYRVIKPDQTIEGGPMYYLSAGLAEIGMAKFGKVISIIFAIFCVGASFGGGNMFQVNQSFVAIAYVFPRLADYDWLFGLVVAISVALVIFGGIQRIGEFTSKLVPLMVSIYLAGCFWVIGNSISEVPTAMMAIFQEAFTGSALGGGVIGILIVGVRRSAFSNGAGLGTAAIAHSAAQTDNPVKEGIIATLEPFIDTIIICNLTALVIVLTGTYGDNIASDVNGAQLAALAFAQVINWFPPVLAGIVVLFGFSTAITWSYYGEKAWIYLFGDQYSFLYKLLFLGCIVLGAVIKLDLVIEFSDMMLLMMALPNILGCILLSNLVAKDLQNYWLQMKLKNALETEIP